MSFEALQALHRRERGVNTQGELARLDESEVVCSECCKEPHPNIGWRGPVRYPRLGNLLEIIRRQSMIFRAHERRKPMPRLLGQFEEELAIG